MKIILSLIVMAFVTRSGCPYYYIKAPLDKHGIHASAQQPALQENQTATAPQAR